MTAPPLLQVDALVKHYRLPRERLLAAPPVVHALQGVSLQLQAARSLGVVGESGCGKSTLARLVMALEAPTSGQVRLDGVDLHVEAVREVEQRVLGTSGGGGGTGSCEVPALSDSFTSEELYDPARFPDLLKTQIDLMVLSMACGLTRVGTLQCSHHTSELLMSRFPGTEMYDPSYDMRSHQASHYGSKHDWDKREFKAFVQQRQYWVDQFAYLLERLDAMPEGDGTMLDNSLVVLCTEVCDGNTHLHDNMPFVVAGGGGGAINNGRLLQYGYERHGKLFVSLARAMGEDLWSFGDSASGDLYGVLR